MGTLTCPEIREIDCPNLENAVERARSRFDEAVAICRQLAEATLSWVKLGRLLTVLERDRDYKRLGFDSMGRCIEEMILLSGYERSSIYAFKKLYEESAANGVEVPDMPLGSAHVFKKLPKHLQSDPGIVEAVKKAKPKQFREKIAAEHPECHIEATEEVKLHFDTSFMPVFHECVESTRIIEDDPEMSYERCLELWCISWSNETWGDSESGISNIMCARQLRELGK